MKITHIVLRGYGAIDNLTLSSSEHIKQFYSAAEWFVKHQDIDTGGWAIPVKRKLAAGFQDLQPGKIKCLILFESFFTIIHVTYFEVKNICA